MSAVCRTCGHPESHHDVGTPRAALNAARRLLDALDVPAADTATQADR